MAAFLLIALAIFEPQIPGRWLDLCSETSGVFCPPICDRKQMAASRLKRYDVLLKGGFVLKKPIQKSLSVRG